MAVLRSSAWVDAPVGTTGAALRHTRTAEVGLREVSVRGRVVTSPGELLVPGDEVAFGVARLPVLRTRVVRADAEEFASALVSGPLPELTHRTSLHRRGERTLLADELRWSPPLGAAGRFADAVLLRRFARAVLARRTAAVRELAESWAGRRIVVGTAIVHNGQLLAQQRRYPERQAGRWELPGGRVEPGESEEDAVVRECTEELGAAVRPVGRVGTDVPLHGDLLLRLHRAELVEGGSAPRALEHRAVRWVGAAEISSLDWLGTDRALVPVLRPLLG